MAWGIVGWDDKGAPIWGEEPAEAAPVPAPTSSDVGDPFSGWQSQDTSYGGYGKYSPTQEQIDAAIRLANNPSLVGDSPSQSGSSSWVDSLAKVFNIDSSKGLFENLLNAASSKAGMATLGALMGYMNKAEQKGGGYEKRTAGPVQYERKVRQGKYGPISEVVKKAATGGIMQAYAQGGPVAMEDGGFVMTADATKAAEKLLPRGIAQLAPGAKMIRGPGNGTSDSIPAYIQGRNGRTPALVSNGESYFSKADVENHLGGTRAAYDLMHALERRA